MNRYDADRQVGALKSVIGRRSSTTQKRTKCYLPRRQQRIAGIDAFRSLRMA